MSMQMYPRAPIIEAVINFSLQDQLDDKIIAKMSKTDKTDYVFSERDLVANYHINIGTEDVTVHKVDNGVRLSSVDRADICIYRKTDFVCSRLAPYLGWDVFFSRAQIDWARLKKVVKAPHIKRVGIRYINRIDVPKSATEKINVEDYLHVWPHLPKFGDSAPISGYVMQVTRQAAHDCMLIINTTPTVSPLPNYDSFLLDLDLYRDTKIPESDDELWELLGTMRAIKNGFFEQMITEKARALFR